MSKFPAKACFAHPIDLGCALAFRNHTGIVPAKNFAPVEGHIMSHTLTAIAATLKTARVNSGMSQGQIAEQLGVSRSWVSQFERGMTKGPALDRILTLADALGVSVTFDLQTDEAEVVETPETVEVVEVIETVEVVETPEAPAAPVEPVFHFSSGLTAARALQSA